MSRSDRRLWIVADDLSGAADCAAAFAHAVGPFALALGEMPPDVRRVALDTDSRAMESAAASAVVARAFAHVPADADGVLVYKKIDSTLRGHVAAELAAALAAAPRFAGAVIAPAFPEQGRTLSHGRLCLHGRPCDGPQADLMDMLEAAGVHAALVRQPLQDSAAVRRRIEAAMAAGAIAVVVDAIAVDDLARLARAVLAGPVPPWLLAGSAGLARALARQIAPAQQQAPPACGAPALALVGSFSPASAAQLRQLEASGTAQVVRLAGEQWLGLSRDSGTVPAALQALRAGLPVALAIAGPVVQPFSREWARAMAAVALPLLRDAGTCVLTGGDTARALFDVLGVRQAQVDGELEPGISRIRIAAAQMPGFVLKAGGFGDTHTLERIIRNCTGPLRPVPAPDSVTF